MNIELKELEARGYRLLDSLNHKELPPFIRTYLKKPTLSSILYITSNLLILAMIVINVTYNSYLQTFNFFDRLAYLSYGIALAFGLIPLHEYIHVLAMKSQGAKNTSYDMNLKKFYFMAIADKFVANKNEFMIIAFAPFVIINTVLLILIIFVSHPWALTIMGILFTHTAFSSGDFGLLSYFDFHKSLDVVTVDNKEKGESYFYGKKRNLN